MHQEALVYPGYPVQALTANASESTCVPRVLLSWRRTCCGWPWNRRTWERRCRRSGSAWRKRSWRKYIVCAPSWHKYFACAPSWHEDISCTPSWRRYTACVHPGISTLPVPYSDVSTWHVSHPGISTLHVPKVSRPGMSTLHVPHLVLCILVWMYCLWPILAYYMQQKSLSLLCVLARALCCGRGLFCTPLSTFRHE